MVHKVCIKRRPSFSPLRLYMNSPSDSEESLIAMSSWRTDLTFFVMASSPTNVEHLSVDIPHQYSLMRLVIGNRKYSNTHHRCLLLDQPRAGLQLLLHCGNTLYTTLQLHNGKTYLCIHDKCVCACIFNRF